MIVNNNAQAKYSHRKVDDIQVQPKFGIRMFMTSKLQSIGSLPVFVCSEYFFTQTSTARNFTLQNATIILALALNYPESAFAFHALLAPPKAALALVIWEVTELCLFFDGNSVYLNWCVAFHCAKLLRQDANSPSALSSQRK